MMDRRSLYDGLNQLELDMQKNLEDLVSMKETLLELVEKNAKLVLVIHFLMKEEALYGIPRCFME